ncbi:MAG: ABC transporter substrate-binding protein [Azoarcus sp.]|jgi:ABC-type Fe3+ transport system substrate-binding protein|nr:ABC transporter substrate-binding protein [Azoarcus sp.]
MNAPVYHDLPVSAPVSPPWPGVSNDAAAGASAALDLLGRLPVPLRRPFKAGLDAALSRAPRRFDCRMISGAQWYTPFDRLADWPAARLPAVLVTTLHADLFAPGLLRHYTPARAPLSMPLHPACEAAGLRDARGVFRNLALVPFVFLVDEKRLKGRAAPRGWADLLDPAWADEIVFGGWRPDESSPYRDYCGYLLLCLYLEFGAAGLAAFAANVRHLQHNVRTAARAGSNSQQAGAVSVLPWLQAELCPRRERVRIAWPEDGALVMPLSWLVKRGMEEGGDAAPLVEYLQSRELGAMFARNAYPPVHQAAGAAAAYPPGVRLKWPGWAYFHMGKMAADSAAASGIFFAAWYGRHGIIEGGKEASCSS